MGKEFRSNLELGKKHLESIFPDEIEDVKRFKNLLEYFISHLEWRENQDSKFIGYEKYIKPIKPFKSTGKGEKGDGIQSQIKDWDNYNGKTIGITIYNSHGQGYQKRNCYLHWIKTWYNIHAIWENNHITSLYLSKEPKADAKSELKNTIEELGLFTENITDDLKNFFHKYMKYGIGDSQMTNEQDKLINETKTLLQNTKNLILTGAPGTGKTYLAKQIAEKMGCTENEIDFVQFHPSYDYTDFVEGLRPVQDESGTGQIGFKRIDGVFKEFCAKALENLQRKGTGIDDSSNFDAAWNALLEEVRENIANGKLTKIGIWDYGLSSTDSLKYESKDTQSKYTFTVTKKNVFDAYRGIKARPSGYFQKYMKEVADYMQRYGLKEYREQTQPLNKNFKNYVFIIDEINRGEVSKIFGELFYSVDPEYRVTASDLEKVKSGKTITTIKTQYANLEKEGNAFDVALNSKDFGHFFIPENVYIIGTMNDIDRSVESMDFAFRRRFAWKEITAEETQYMLEESVDKNGETHGLSEELRKKAIEKMNRLNNAIWKDSTENEEDNSEKIEDLNDAYHIGASYFLKLNQYEGTDEEKFAKLWEYHLKGVLEEYLRGNPEKDNLMKKLKAAYDETEGI